MNDKVEICWLCGSYFLCENIMNSIKSQVGDDAHIEVYDDSVSAEYIENKIFEGDIFSDRKRIIITHLPVFSGNLSKSHKRWISIFKNLPTGMLIIIKADKPKSPKNPVWIYVNKNGRVFNKPRHIDRGSAISFVREKIKIEGKTIDDDSISILVDLVGEKDKKGVDVDRLYLSVYKICCYKGSAKNISKSDILQTVTNQQDFIIWSMFDAMDNNDLFTCYNLYHQACLLSKNKTELINQIMFMSLWRYRLLVFLKEFRISGRSNDEILDKISEFYKLSRNDNGKKAIFDYELDKTGNRKRIYSDGMVRNILMGNFNKRSPLDCYSRRNIFDIIKCVNECLYKMRTSCLGIELDLVIDKLFMTACQSFSEKFLAYHARSCDE
ncbi:MAG: DNA polymerase III subunit delta [Elusimicrobiota bacterium]